MNLLLVFPNTHQAIKCDAVLQEAGIPHGIIPTPRWLSASCGIGVSFSEEWRDRVWSEVRRAGLEPEGLFPLEPPPSEPPKAETRAPARRVPEPPDGTGEGQ